MAYSHFQQRGLLPHANAALTPRHRLKVAEAEPRGELDGWLHYFNRHRPHTACGNQPPFPRLTDLPGRCT